MNSIDQFKDSYTYLYNQYKDYKDKISKYEVGTSKYDFAMESIKPIEKKLKENQIDIRSILDQVKKFQVAVPTWGVGTGGTRFARFPGIGEPQNIYDKIGCPKPVETVIKKLKME